MNTPKTTAVDWLLTELNLRLCKIKSEPDGLVRETMIDLLLIGTEQAIEIEREQIEQAYGDGLNAYRTDFCNRTEYYDKTYGKSE
jgi:hypothetical protein